jgi:hypothetical protein
MHADVSRSTFRPDKHFSTVVAQQGRVQLDAEANEQAAIQARLARTVAADLIGRHAGPAGAAGFEIGFIDDDPRDLSIGAGRYYVDGVLVESDRPAALDPVPSDDQSTKKSTSDAAASGAAWTYWSQPDAFLDPEQAGDQLPALPVLVYLKVSERLVTAVEDPDIRETALGSALPDTTARLRVVWQVLPILDTDGFPSNTDPTPDRLRKDFDDWADARSQPASRIAVRAQRPAQTDEDPCIIHPDARYRGPENQLYRIEVHASGQAGTATFKWSRDNGSVIAPVAAIEGEWVTLAAPARDDKLALRVGDWTELVDDAYLQRGMANPLLRVVDVDTFQRRVRLSAEPPAGVGRLAARHPYLRRWDQQTQGEVPIAESRWLDLEDGVQVWFAAGGTYRSGEYWTAPARTLNGDVEWPRDGLDRPLLVPPHGPRVHYAPLAWVRGADGVDDLRQIFGPLTA